MRLLTLLVLITAASVIGGPAGAQDAAELDRAKIRSMASDLRNLITAQESYFADHGRYAAEIAGLGYVPSRGNHLDFVNPGTNGYGARIRRDDRAGTCVVHINLPSESLPRTAVEKKAFPEGEPACDGDGEMEANRWASTAQREVHRALVGIAKLQERQFGRTGAYSTDIAALIGNRTIPDVTVTIEVTSAGGRMDGFLLTATHARFPGVSCVLRSGAGTWMARAVTAAERLRPTTELQAVCDNFAR